MATENEYDVIPANSSASPTDKATQTQRLYVVVSIPDIDMKVH